MGGGTGRLLGRDVKWDLAMHACIYFSFVPLRLYGKNFARTFFADPVPAKRDPGSLNWDPG